MELEFKCPGPKCKGKKKHKLAAGQLVWETSADHHARGGGATRISESLGIDMVILCGACVLDIVASRSGVHA